MSKIPASLLLLPLLLSSLPIHAFLDESFVADLAEFEVDAAGLSTLLAGESEIIGIAEFPRVSRDFGVEAPTVAGDRGLWLDVHRDDSAEIQTSVGFLASTG